MGQTNEILNYVIDIKEDVAGINGHLKQLNGTVTRQEQTIIENKKELSDVKGKLYKVGTVGFVCWSIFMVIVNMDKFINFFRNIL